MLRSPLSRPVFKTLQSKLSSSPVTFNASSTLTSRRIHSLTLANKRPILPLSSISITAKYASKSSPPYDKPNTEAEKNLADTPLEAHPDLVSDGSSIRQVSMGSEQPVDTSKRVMTSAVAQDLKTIRETFALTEVPRESYYLGAAGVLPYLFTSLSTVYLSYDIGHAQENMGQGYLLSPETAYQLLHLLEPVQIGYGAVIISFLGAIHWGLEYAGYGGHHGYRRYAIGVLAPAVAWPTMLMPVETALITQFLAFNFLYFADARATVRGWCPPWYSTYRFVLTFVVGASIVISLIGRGQIVKVTEGPDGKLNLRSLPGPAEGMKKLRDEQWENLEREEKERVAAAAKAEEEGEEEEEEGGEEKEESDEEGEEDGEKDEKKDDKKNDKKEEKKDKKEDEKK